MKNVNFKGKQILLIGLMLLVVAAGYYRWTQNNSDEAVTVTSDTLPADAEASHAATDDGYFVTARRDRDSARDKSVEMWNDILRKEESSPEARNEAQSKISQSAEDTESENRIESLVRSKGYEDCIAFVDENGVSAVVKSDGLTASDAAQIKDIIVAQTGAAVSNIKISSKK